MQEPPNEPENAKMIIFSLNPQNRGVSVGVPVDKNRILQLPQALPLPGLVMLNLKIESPQRSQHLIAPQRSVCVA